ncbi:hypothetical protein N8T08_001086 [Aspergillus melleus]|uniref:Uncharacterized protein n=1 Tax=Aspergillus melleus TaxID=138277 RepID=A0ACC3ANY1_9EURO|nr:hypothetical protein N8T08_001086 [Aspergillus melleus]
MPLPNTERVAIVGGGCTGITCFWALQNSNHDVHLFEASSALGGRIKAIPYEHGKNRADVNTESPLFNVENSPNLVSMLGHLGVATSPAPFFFNSSDGINTFEWGSSFLQSILLRPWLLCSIETYRLLVDFVWLKYWALDSLTDKSWALRTSDSQASLSTQNYLSNEGYSSTFYDGYLSPLFSTLWKTNAGRFLPQFPFDALMHCLNDYQILSPRHTASKWQRINMGVHHFVKSMTREFPPANIHLKTRVREVSPVGKKGYTLLTSDTQPMYFDHVVFAVDSQEALQLFQSKLSSEEREIIQNFKAAQNVAVLHSDVMLSPSVSPSWPAHDYIIPQGSHNQHHCCSTFDPATGKSSLTHNVNILQDISTCLFGRIFITLNPFTPPHPHLVQGVWEFTDPEPNPEYLYAQTRLHSIQNKRGLSYGFRWTGRGFLEDSVTAGLEIAVDHLGAKVPFEVDHRHALDSSPFSLDLGIPEHIARLILVSFRVYFQMLELGLILLGTFWLAFPNIRTLIMRWNKDRAFSQL